MRISDWSSDVCSSDLARLAQIIAAAAIAAGPEAVEIGVVVGLPGHPDLRIEGVPAIAIVEGVAGAILEDDRAARDCGGKDSIDPGMLLLARVACAEVEDRKSTRLNSSH